MNARRLSGCTTICARALPVHVFDVPKLAPNVTYQGNNNISVSQSRPTGRPWPHSFQMDRVLHISVSLNPPCWIPEAVPRIQERG